MPETQKTKKHDFVEIKYTGYANNEVFDSNILEDLKKLDPKATEELKTIIVIGEEMVVSGLDKALEDKELNKKYEIELTAKEGFGERDRNLMKVIPLKAFTEQNVTPRAGMMFTLDNILVKIITVSGARVTVDFNNPMAGKALKYKFEIIRKVDDEKEKVETLLKLYFRIIPEYEIKENNVIVKGPKNFETSRFAPKSNLDGSQEPAQAQHSSSRVLEMFVNAHKEKFRELIGKELDFEEHVHEHEHKEEKHEHTNEEEHKAHEHNAGEKIK